MRRLVNRVSVEASFFKKMSAAENLSYAARFYGMGPRETHTKIPRILERVGFPPSAAQRVDGEPVARDAAEGRARARPAHLTGAAAARRADDRSRPALEAGGADVHPRDPRAARLDDPPLHARHEGGGGARRPCRPARPRRAALPRAGRGRARALRASRRSRRRSSPPPAARSRTRRRRTTRRGRCSRNDDRRHPGVHAPQDHQRRADRPLRGRRAQPVPDEALPPLGSRVPAVDGREHAHDRVHRARRRHRAGRAERARDEAARRRRDLGVPRDHLRDRHRDGRVGALGRHDRVHVHGAGLPSGAPDRHGRVRGHLRPRARCARVLRRRRVHRHPPSARQLRRCDRAARDRVDLVHRRRDDDRGPAARLAGEGHAARLRRAGT